MNKLIISERLIIRNFTLQDVPKVYFMSLEDGMKEFIPDQVYESEEEAKQVVDYLMSQYTSDPAPDKAPYVLGIELKESNELIGHVGLSPFDNIIEIGYAIEDKYQGKGFATEAVKAMSEWSLKELQLSSISGIVDKNNTGSIKVLEKAGYVFQEEIKNKLRYEFK
ncbi:MAG: GNAT family N-acetyltransferase [Candidatus Delongbacteria bacterium]|jgi:ribosomal-protein-alanine N-acetyltransferase|nr:GNAT family N-acetyltransferase [Candidatus Delongbacteria bacterium]